MVPVVRWIADERGVRRVERRRDIVDSRALEMWGIEFLKFAGPWIVW